MTLRADTGSAAGTIAAMGGKPGGMRAAGSGGRPLAGTNPTPPDRAVGDSPGALTCLRGDVGMLRLSGTSAATSHAAESPPGLPGGIAASGVGTNRATSDVRPAVLPKGV